MQVVRYESGQLYKKHHDYFDESRKEDYEKRGGQRTWTSLTYLNKVNHGGQTIFTNISKNIIPSIGKMVLWKNMDNGQKIVDSMHEARPPINCTKWVANIWVRERKFQ